MSVSAKMDLVKDKPGGLEVLEDDDSQSRRCMLDGEFWDWEKTTRTNEDLINFIHAQGYAKGPKTESAMTQVRVEENFIDFQFSLDVV